MASCNNDGLVLSHDGLVLTRNIREVNRERSPLLLFTINLYDCYDHSWPSLTSTSSHISLLALFTLEVPFTTRPPFALTD
jgi:hypothetical protein